MQSIASSIGVAISGSVFFDAITTGTAEQAYQHTLTVLAALLVAFLALTFAFPRKSTPRPPTATTPTRPSRTQCWYQPPDRRLTDISHAIKSLTGTGAVNSPDPPPTPACPTKSQTAPTTAAARPPTAR
nr:hypothetical protein GCM10020092_024500 [Actinoplanes digitatis]